MDPLVYVIILTYNGKKWIDNCLKTVLSSSYSNFKVLIVDNASIDGCVDDSSLFPSQIEIVRNSKNYGFAGGMNIGIKVALQHGAKYVLLLNQDTKVDIPWITEMVKISEADERIGILTPMQYNYDGSEIDVNFRGLLAKDSSMMNDFIETDTVIGAASLIRETVFAKIGYFDTYYFLYCEESDFCRRALMAGFKIGIATKSRIFHWHTLLHKKEIRLKNFYLFIKNNYIYRLSDTRTALFRSFLTYYQLELKKTHSQGYIKGFLSILFKIHLICYMPIVIKKRFRDNTSVIRL